MLQLYFYAVFCTLNCIQSAAARCINLLLSIINALDNTSSCCLGITSVSVVVLVGSHVCGGLPSFYEAAGLGRVTEHLKQKRSSRQGDCPA
jgi:hypothetical protein